LQLGHAAFRLAVPFRGRGRHRDRHRRGVAPPRGRLPVDGSGGRGRRTGPDRPCDPWAPAAYSFRRAEIRVEPPPPKRPRTEVRVNALPSAASDLMVATISPSVNCLITAPSPKDPRASMSPARRCGRHRQQDSGRARRSRRPCPSSRRCERAVGASSRDAPRARPS
jgi:hypothetical protein